MVESNRLPYKLLVLYPTNFLKASVAWPLMDLPNDQNRRLSHFQTLSPIVGVTIILCT